MTDTLLIACPKCSTLNRFPRAKLDGGSAGKCGQYQGNADAEP